MKTPSARTGPRRESAGEHAVSSPGRPRRARQVTARIAIGVAMTATVARASPSEDVRGPTPTRVVVVPGGCGCAPVDAAAVAAALRVEMIQEGVFAVDVAPQGTLPVEDPSVATVRLLPASCQKPVGAPGFEITGGPTERSVRSTLAIADIDLGIRARVAALVIAERLRASWADLVSAPPAVEAAGAGSGAPAGGRAPSPGGAQDMPGGSPSAPAAPAPTAHSIPEEVAASPEPDLERAEPLRGAPVGPAREIRHGRHTTTVAAHRFVLGAALEGRSFFGPATGLAGPRAFAVLPASFSALRVEVDMGVAWGAAHDALGAVSVMLASGGLGFAMVVGREALHLEIGPKAEIGWTRVQGFPRSGARGATGGTALSAASVLAGFYAEIARHWRGLAALDVGFAFSGVEARADRRPVADTSGLMLVARAGIAYAF
jgi:hypothetical protein